MRAQVSITNCKSYEPSAVREALLKVTEKNFPDIKGKKVLLKPNVLSDMDPSSCITTNPEVVRQAIRLCKEKGAASIVVGDSPGMQNAGFKPVKCGIQAVCEEEGVIWSDFTKDPVPTDINGNTKLLAKAVLEADVIIGLCKMKTHQLMYATGAVKNFFGTIPSLHKSQCHVQFQSREAFADFLLDLHETIKPAYSVMDAVVSMEGPGPANGRPKATGLLLASENDYALDYAQALIMGYEPDSIPVLHAAKSKGLLPIDIDYPLLNANDLIYRDYVRIPYRKKTKIFRYLVLPFVTRFFEQRKLRKEPKPVFLPEKCIGCQRCVNICPGRALVFDKDQKRIVADYTKCIRCYCCHEMCPVAAIVVNK